MKYTSTADDAVGAALHLLRLDDEIADRDRFIARLAHEPELVAAIAFWHRIESIALALLRDERPPEHCWARIEARLGRPH